MPRDAPRVYQLTEADVAAVYRANVVAALGRPKVLAAAAIIAALLAGTQALSGQLATPTILSVLAFAALWVVGMATWGFRSMAAKALRTHRGLRGRQELAWDADGLRMRNDAGEAFHRWDAFHRVRVDRDHLVLFTSGQAFMPVPRRALAAGDVAALVGRLRGAGVPVGGEAPP